MTRVHEARTAGGAWRACVVEPGGRGSAAKQTRAACLEVGKVRGENGLTAGPDILLPFGASF